MSSSRRLEIIRLGRLAYQPAIEQMEARFRCRLDRTAPDTLFLVEHDPVITMGRRKTAHNILLNPAELEARGISVVETGRGGDVTYHAPGQVVAYPVLDLKPDRCDVRRYVADLEQTMVDVAGTYGLQAQSVDGMIGAWIQDTRKVGAVGVRLSRWVTCHGFALNVNIDLDGFGVIVPCGITDRGVTSIAAELGQEIDFDDAVDRVEKAFLERFEYVAI